MAKQSEKILLVGGGTGGHVVPIFELYKKLKEYNENYDITIIGSGSTVEKRFFNKASEYRTIKTGKLRRHLTLKNLIEAFYFTIGFFQSFLLLIFHRPSIIFSKGGFVAVPIIIWANILNIPYFIHESDTEMGIGNKIGVKRAKKIFVAFPAKFYKNLLAEKTVYNIPIVRKEILLDKISEKKDFGFINNDPVILVTGGSQGSHNINDNIIYCVKELLNKYNIIHQTGDNDFSRTEKFKSTLPENLQQKYYTAAFLSIDENKDWMQEAIKIASLVIARAGATTIFELATLGKPMILVPWKHAAADHQTRNARLVEQSGGAVVITDDDLKPKLLAQRIDEIFKDGRAEQLSENTRKIFKSDGLEIVAKAIIAELNK